MCEKIIEKERKRKTERYRERPREIARTFFLIHLFIKYQYIDNNNLYMAFSFFFSFI